MNFAEHTFLVDESLLDVSYTETALEFFETFLASTNVSCISESASNSNVALYIKGLAAGLSAKKAMSYAIQNSSSQVAAAAKSNSDADREDIISGLGAINSRAFGVYWAGQRDRPSGSN